MAVAHHVVITCNHPRCGEGIRVRMLTSVPGNTKVARAAVAAFGWVFRTSPGGKGRGRFGKEADFCPAHAKQHPAQAEEAQVARRAARG